VSALALEALAEVVADRFTSEQLFALAGRVAAREARPPETHSTPDLATCLAFDLEGTVDDLVERMHEEAGLDLDLVGAYLLKLLQAAGVADAEEIVALATGWRPRSAEEREVAVAKAMLAEGFTPAQIEGAMREMALC